MSRTILVLAVLLLPAAWATAQGTSPGPVTPSKEGDRNAEVTRGEIKTPWDFAPRERIISGRDPMSFRKEGTLLAKMSREVRSVATDDLYRRKLELYGGRRFYHNLAGDPNCEQERLARVYHDGRPPLGLAVEEEKALVGWVGWTLVGVIACVVAVGWKKKWFVPFSQRRKARQAVQTSSTASDKPKDRGAEVPKIELVRYD